MAEYKLIPYGISDFAQVRREGMYVVDKTAFLEKMERAGNFLFLIRPRRFGKSLFLSMLRYYYDVNEAERFDEFFGGLYVHEHPTKFRNSFQVLKLDFSRVTKGGGTDYEKKFYDYMDVELDFFMETYGKHYPQRQVDKFLSLKSADDKLNYLNRMSQAAGTQLYLIVDEYDNFTNDVLNEQGEAVYHAMTHAEGFYRGVFKLFKGMFHRIIMMGVSPVTMDDVTSGYNIAIALTLEEEFNAMLGFSETEVREMIRYYKDAGAIDADEDALIAAMKPWYDGYCFAKRALDKPRMFNCDMVLYFMRRYISYGLAPDDMVDPNTKTDYAKLDKIIRLDKLDGNRKSVLLDIATSGSTLGEVKSSFPAHHLTDPDMFKSLLYYYGMLTIVGTDGADLVLGIPNNNVRMQYYEYLQKEFSNIAAIDISALSDAYKSAAFRGDWRPMMDHICRKYSETTSIRSLIEGERNLQGFMQAMLSLNRYYIVAPEMEMSHGYLDFFLMPDKARYAEIAHSYIIELKYLKMSDTAEAAAKQWDDAVKQIKGYAAGKAVEQMRQGTELHLIVAQIKGHEPVRLEEVGA